MPSKRTRRTRNRRPDELRAWSGFFKFGHDYFSDLTALDLHSEADARKAAPEAWQRLGAAFLETWQPTSARQEPWALVEFGPPNG